MTSTVHFPNNLTEIDPLTRPDHSYLTADDECMFLGEYTARKGFAHSNTNNLIFNLKKPLNRKGEADWRYKGIAIQDAARAFRNAIDDRVLRSATFVPIPPSKAKNHPEYDDRITQVIQSIDTIEPVDCRELVLQIRSMAAFHLSSDRPGPEELESLYRVDANLIEPSPTYIVLIDDILTTGSHFKATKRCLRRTFTDVPIVGYFVARRVPDATDVEAFVDEPDF